MNGAVALRFAAALEVAPVTATEFRVAHAVARFTDGDGRNAFPGVARLAEVCRISARTVERALVRLRSLGVLFRTSRSDRWRGKADVYAVAGHLASPRRRSTDTGGRPPELRTTGDRARVVPEPVAAALDAHALGARERQRLEQRAVGLLDAGTPVDVVVAALGAPVPVATRHLAALLHGRLLNVQGLTRSSALGWVARLTDRAPRRRGRVRGRRPSTTPRTAAEHGETTQTLAGW